MFVEEYKKECKQNCSFCEKQKADAVWIGEKEIYICKKCAMNYLPQLMADAIVEGTSEQMFKESKGPTSEITKENLIFERFHSAFSGALIRKFRNNKED